MRFMYEKGDMIFYGSTGVYRVEGVGPVKHIRDCDPDRSYYQLTSLHGRETTYVPVDVRTHMRPVMSRQEAETLLDKVGGLQGQPCAARDTRALREHYQALLSTHECLDLASLIKAVDAKGKRAAREGKHLGKIDQEYKKRAERLLCEELSVSLELPYEQAQSVLSKAMGKGADS